MPKYLNDTGVGTLKDVVEESLDAKAGISYVGNYGAVENNASVDWASVVASVASVSDTIYFGCGQWNVGSTGIDIPSSIKNIAGCGAKLYSDSETSPEYLMRVSGSATKLNGFQFVGNGSIDKLLHVNNSSGNILSISDCQFRNVGSGNYGIYNDYIGLQVTGCFFINDSLHIGGTAIKSHTDNVIGTCKFFRFDNAIAARGCNVTNCYVWCVDGTERNAFVNENYPTGARTGQTYDVIATNCEFDCVGHLVVNPRNVQIVACQFYWNDTDISADCHLFWNASGVTSMGSINLSNSVFKIQSISYDIYTFGCEAFDNDTAQALRVQRYESRGNLVSNDVYTISSITRYHLVIGIIGASTHSSSGTKYLTHLTKDANNTSTENAVYSILGNALEWKYCRDNTNRDFILLSKNIRSGTNAYMVAYYLTDDASSVIDEYLPITNFAVNEVQINSAPAFNWGWSVSAVSASSLPSEDSYTTLSASKIMTS